MALSHFSFYTIGFLWGLFFRRFWFPACVIETFHLIFFAMIWGLRGLSNAQYLLQLPLSALFGLLIGYWLAEAVNLRQLVFLKRFARFGLWIPLVLCELIILHATLVLWELNELLGVPLNYVFTFILYALEIVVFYFVNRYSDVWEYMGPDGPSRDDYAAELFHVLWGIFQLLQILVFLAIQWSAPSFNPFWISLIVFGVQSLIVCSIAAWSRQYSWRIHSVVRLSANSSHCANTYLDVTQDESIVSMSNGNTTTTTATSTMAVDTEDSEDSHVVPLVAAPIGSMMHSPATAATKSSFKKQS